MKIILSFILSFLVLEISAVEWQHVLEDGSSVKWEANLDSPSALPLEMQSGDLASYRLMMNGVGAQSLPPTIKFDSYASRFNQWMNSRGFVERTSGGGGFYENFLGRSYQTTKEIFYRCEYDAFSKGLELEGLLIEFKADEDILIELLENGELISCGIGSLVIDSSRLNQDLDYFVLRCSSRPGKVNSGLMWVHAYKPYEEVYPDPELKFTVAESGDLEWKAVTSELWRELNSVDIPMWYKRSYKGLSKDCDWVRLQCSSAVKRIVINGQEVKSGSLIPATFFKEDKNEVLVLRHGLYYGLNQDVELTPLSQFSLQAQLDNDKQFMSISNSELVLAVWVGNDYVGVVGGLNHYQTLDLRAYDLKNKLIKVRALQGDFSQSSLSAIHFHAQAKHWRRLKWTHSNGEPYLYRGASYPTYSPASDFSSLTDYALNETLQGSFYLTEEDLKSLDKKCVFQVPGGIARALWKQDDLWLPKYVKVNNEIHPVGKEGLELNSLGLNAGWNVLEIAPRGRFIEPALCIGKEVSGDYESQVSLSFDVKIKGVSTGEALIYEDEKNLKAEVELVLPAGREATIYMNGEKWLNQSNPTNELKIYSLKKLIKIPETGDLLFAMGQTHQRFSVKRIEALFDPIIDLRTLSLSNYDLSELMGYSEESVPKVLGAVTTADKLNFGNMVNEDFEVPSIFDILPDGSAAYLSLYGKIRSKLLRESRGGKACKFIIPKPNKEQKPVKMLEFMAFLQWRLFMDRVNDQKFSTLEEGLKIYESEIQEFRESRQVYVDVMLHSLVDELIFGAEEVEP